MITNGHVDYAPVWVMHCYAIEFDTHPLPDVETEEEAKEEAIRLVLTRLAALTEDVRKAAGL